MAIAYLASVTAGCNSGQSAAPTGNINTTGATLLVACVGYDGTVTQYGSVTDSQSNTWNFITSASQAAGSGNVAIFYCSNPTTSTTHSFSTSGSYLPAIAVSAFSGVSTSSPLDQSNAATNSYGPTIQPGSVTPTQNNELIVTAVAPNNSGTWSINDGFSTPISIGWEAAYNTSGIGSSYLVQSTAAAINPTWTLSNYAQISAVIATFEAAAASTIYSPSWEPSYPDFGSSKMPLAIRAY